jgi:galactonate dehydratase
MKIRSIRTHVMGIPQPNGQPPGRRNWVFVRVETDEGIEGVGEATTEWYEHAVVSLIEHSLTPLLIGRDPARIHRVWQEIRRGFHWRGGVVESSAMSAIEMALWDIAGKSCGKPVYQLLGGAVRDRIRLYARGDLGLGSEREELLAAREEGFTAFKTGPGDYTEPFDENQQVRRAVDSIRELRKTAGDDCDIMIDCGAIFTVSAAFRMIEELRDYHLLFIEEPVTADIPSGLQTLSASFPGERIASGERMVTRWGFREWLQSRAVSVLQADISHCGGLLELLRIASAAELNEITMAPHNPYSPVALAANLHACAVMQNHLILEHCRHRPWFNDVQVFGPRIQDGCIELNDRPGLGIELDWSYVERHPYVAMPLRLREDAYGGLAST